MKKHVVSALTALSFVMIFGAASTHAQQPRCLTAQIPFTFGAMDRMFTEGTYKICTSPAILKLFSLENDEGRTVGFINPLAVDSIEAQKPPALVFNRYGNSYFLSEIRSSSVVLEVRRSKAEKELRRSFSSPQGNKRRPEVVTVFASPAPGKMKSS